MPTLPPLDARKRPRQRRSEVTVEAVLEAAARILETRGLAGYNTNDIARVAGISVGSLYQYFPNKDAITSALVHREMEALRLELEGLRNVAAGQPRMERLIGIAVEHQLGRARLSRLLDVEEERLSLGADLADHREGMTELVRQVLADLPLKFARTDIAADDVIAIIRGMVDMAGIRGENDAASLVWRISRAVLGYLDDPYV
jgi:AcrR family transcriptional regulator